jgi:beta-lactam-binding protein with PASTA domain
MQISRNILVSMVPLLDQMTVEQIKDALMNLGIEVEATKIVDEQKNLVIGRILEVKPHPQSKEQ